MIVLTVKPVDDFWVVDCSDENIPGDGPAMAESRDSALALARATATKHSTSIIEVLDKAGHVEQREVISSRRASNPKIVTDAR